MAELDYDIAKIFEDMELDLIRSMKHSLQSHKNQELKEGFDWEMWQSRKLRELRAYQKRNYAIIGKQSGDLKKNIETIIKQQYYEGVSKVDSEVRTAVKSGYITKSKPEFGRVNDKKLKALVKSINNDFTEAKKAVLRKTTDEYRKTVFTAEANLSSGAKTLNQSIDMTTRLFLEQGINCITYKDGRKVNIASYAEMALRTAHLRAYLVGEGERRMEWGECLVMVSQYMQCSEICLPWQGGVYVDDVYSGASAEQIAYYTAKGYKKLSTAIANGLFHPNCKHTLSTWFEDISTMPTPQDAEEVRQNREQVAQKKYCQRQIQKYKRMKVGSCDEDNAKKYGEKVKQWQGKLSELKTTFVNEKKRKKAKNISGKAVAKVDENAIITLTDNEQRALNRYISSDSYKINEKLRNNTELSDDDKDFIGNLDSALSKLPNYQGNLVRAVDIADEEKAKEFIDSFVVGEKRIFKEYTSTSSSTDYNPDAKIQIYIQNAGVGKDIRQYNSDEQEILYPRNSKFEVLSKVRRNDVTYILLEEDTYE